MLYLPFDMKRYHVTKTPFMPFNKPHFSFYSPKKLRSGKKSNKYKSFSLVPFYLITTGKTIAWRSESSPFVLEIKFKPIWNYSHRVVADGSSRQIQNGLEARSVPSWRDPGQKTECRTQEIAGITSSSVLLPGKTPWADISSFVWCHFTVPRASQSFSVVSPFSLHLPMHLLYWIWCFK